MNQHKDPPIRTERELEAAAIDLAELYGILCYKFVSPGNAGVPDHIFIFPDGETVYVEFKHPNGKETLKPLQKLRAKEIKDNEAPVYECDSLYGFRCILGYHLDRIVETI